MERKESTIQNTSYRLQRWSKIGPGLLSSPVSNILVNSAIFPDVDDDDDDEFSYFLSLKCYDDASTSGYKSDRTKKLLCLIQL
jgi:hypothetical protein